MKIIFMDVDGVLNNSKITNRFMGVIGINAYLVAIFNRIIFATEAEIVLSSSWRYWPEGCEEIRRRVLPFISKTPLMRNSKCRGDEIREWFKLNPNIEVEKYAILDDDSDFYPDQPLFKTSWQVGLTQEIADKVITHLNS
jgi:hypothetical protein